MITVAEEMIMTEEDDGQVRRKEGVRDILIRLEWRGAERLQ